MRRLRLLTLAATAAAALTLPTGAASAATVQLKGQVVGTPYPSGTRTAIPVLFTKGSADKARLKSPLGVAIVPRAKSVKVPGGASLPGRLRVGDRFRAKSRVSRAARTSVYPRLTLTGLTVTQQSKTLSAEELGQLALGSLTTTVNGLTSSLGSVQTTVDALNSTVNGPSGLVQDVAGLCGLTILGIPLGSAC